MYDVIIIGKGPAGISASLYTARAGLKTLVIGGYSDLSKGHSIDNYYGFDSGISGEELIIRGEKQVKRFGTSIINDIVIALEYEDNGFYKVKTKNSVYDAKAVLLATGSNKKKIKINNIQKFEGKGVHYCTTCDGYFYRDKKVALLGYNDYALNELEDMKQFTPYVSILTNGMEPVVDFGEIEIITKKIKSLEGDEYLDKVVYEDGQYDEFDGIFVAYGTASSADFARKLGVIINGNIIGVDEDQKTNIQGLFAAGDCSSSIKQVATAVGQGCVAGMKIIEYVRNLGR